MSKRMSWAEYDAKTRADSEAWLAAQTEKSLLYELYKGQQQLARTLDHIWLLFLIWSVALMIGGTVWLWHVLAT